MRKACPEQLLPVAHLAGDKAHGYAGGMPEDAHRQFAHKGLAVGRAFSGDYKVCIRGQGIEADGVQQQFYARLAACIQILQEGITQPAPFIWERSKPIRLAESAAN